jgi:hypothetical protein
MKGSAIMASCCGDNKNNRKIKEWGNENNQGKSTVKPVLLISGLLLIGFAIFKFVV